MNPVTEDILMHYGIARRSGRYPWGSGDNPYQHSGDFLGRVEELRKQNFKYTDEKGKTWTGDTAIAKSMGLTTTQFRVELQSASHERRALDVATAKGLREKGYSLNAIAEKMGFENDSSVRSLLNEHSEARMNQAKNTAAFLKERVDEKGMIDVGVGVERYLNVSRTKLDEALYLLEKDGYVVHTGGIPQVTNPGQQTVQKVLCPPGTAHKEIYNYENIHSATDYVSRDDGETFKKRGFQYPESMDSSRLKIRYAEEGGIEKDGVIELRRGVDDLSLGTSHYSQVRILVDGTHYLKGMAVYSDDMPDGVDVIFNTNKKQGTPALGPKDNTVLKHIKNDPENPFGSLIKEEGGQSTYVDKNGNEKLSLINKRSDEGDWSDWKDRVPSQFLSKQTKSLAEKQLNLAIADKKAEYDEICSLNNPTIKRELLKTFAEDCDSAAVHLQAAALPRQKYHVILPVTSLKDTEVYAPNYENGEKVALIRYPHGGTFEIPILTVNNKHQDSKRLLGNSTDAVGINSKVAERLSGADFDGDTVMVIPTNSKVRITSRPALKGLEGFDPKMEYGPETYKGREIKVMKNTQKEMGVISNLITDMTLKGAKDDELAAAVRHSMVVIDAEKHKLDYKKSEIDNNISALKKRYQGTVDENGRYHEGAATLISRAKSQQSVTKRQGSPDIDPETGKLIFKNADDLTYIDKKTGKTIVRTQKSTKMAETDDAYKLVSDMDTPMERVYAEYANTMKNMANQARKEYAYNTGRLKYSPSAKITYSKEVDDLESKLNIALKNAPRERQAQTMANAAVAARKRDNPNLTPGDIKKISQQELTKARLAVGAKKDYIKITDREWEAIQAGAISDNQLTKIINNADIDVLRQRATPRTTTSISSAKISKITNMQACGYSTAEIAKSVGVSPSTVSKYLKGKE